MRRLLYAFDARITKSILAWPKWLRRPMLAITNLGQPLTVLVFAIGIIIWAARKQEFDLIISGAIVVGVIIISSLIKLLLRRARPMTEYAKKLLFASYSFPSGHATAASVGFGLLAYLAFGIYAAPWNLVIAIALCAFALLVGLSRIYLGAHYPSDVIGGFLLGTIGLSVIVFGIAP